MEASRKKAGPTFGERAAAVAREVFGDEPWVILLLVSPTLSAIAMDVVLRGGSLRYFPPKEWLNYFGSSLVCAGFWGGSLWMMARLWDTRGGRFRAAKLGAIGLYFLLFVLPFSFFAYGGQMVYFRVFNSYFSRDSLHLGLELRGTMGAWMATWAIKLAPAAFGMLFISGLAVNAIRRAGRPLGAARPWLPLVSFIAVNVALAMDFVETKGLQAAPPDSCFLHSVAGLIHERILHHEVRGVSIRQPDPLPPMERPAHRPNVILVITESVRSDSICSEKSEGCKAQFLDDVIPERVGLLRMTAQASGTFTSCMTLWTGLAPDADFRTVHHAAFLWEIAKANGYRTAYFGAQNLRYRDLGTYLKVGGIDEIVGAADLGHTSDPHLGAPDELAAARLVEFAKRDETPYFAVLHLSNTHWPYRVDEAMQPFAPHDADPFKGAVTLYNHYRNSVLMQERTVASFLRELKATPGWADTAVAFVSDHGEQFREHGGLYHLNSIFEEEVRIPGFFVFGEKAATAEQVAMMRLFRDRRTFNSDVNATVVDLLGAFAYREKLPFATSLHGRSLLRPPVGEPIMAASTTSGVWEDDNPVYGVIMGDRKVVGGDTTPWVCYDSVADPRERFPLPAAVRCAPLLKAAIAHYPKVPLPKPLASGPWTPFRPVDRHRRGGCRQFSWNFAASGASTPVDAVVRALHYVCHMKHSHPVATFSLALLGIVLGACGSKDSSSSSSGTDPVVGDSSVSSEASGQSQHFTNDVLNAISSSSKTADAAGGDVAAPTVKLWPAGCVTREKDATACNPTSCLVHIKYNDCTGPFGLVHINGGEDVTITTSGGGLDAKWTSVGLTANGHAIDHNADAQITLNADGTRNVGWTGHWDRDREDGTHVTHDGSFTILVDPAQRTRTVNGTESTVHEKRTVNGTVKNMIHKWDASFVEECPSGEIDYASTPSGKTAKIVFDGSAIAQITGPAGNLFRVPLVCPAQ